LYAELTAAGIEVLYDDREPARGSSSRTRELLVSDRVVVGERGLEAGNRYRNRRDTESQQFPLDDALAFIRSRHGP